MKLRWVVAGAVLAVGAGLVVFLALDRGDSRPDRGTVIARVDGDPIYSLDAQARLDSVASSHTDLSMDTDVEQQVLQSLVDDVIVRRAAERLGVELAEGEVAAEVEKVKRMSGPPDEFDQWLDKQGMSLAELERRIELQLVWGRVQQAVTRDVTVDGQEVEDYYEAHTEEFTTTEGTRPLFEVRPSIEETLLSDKQDDAFVAWLEAEREKVQVEILDESWEAAR